MDASNANYDSFSGFIRWIKDDFRKKELRPMKLLIFSFYGATLVFLNYNVVHMKSLGINVQEMSWIFALLPITMLLSGPLSGAIADKVGNFKLILVGCVLLLGLNGLLFLAVPVGRIKTPLPNKIDFYLTCGEKLSSRHIFYSLPSGSCNWKDKTFKSEIKNLECGKICPINTNERDQKMTFVFQQSPAVNLVCAKQECFVKQARKSDITLSVAMETNGFEDSEVFNFKYPINASVLHNNQKMSYRCERQGECMTACKASFQSDAMCNNKDYLMDVDPFTTFVFYLVVRVSQAILTTVTCSLIDGASLALLVEYQGDLGIQWLSASIGCSIIAPLAGIIADRFLENDYRPLFISFFVMTLLCAALIANINLEFKSPAKRLTKNVMKLILRIPVLIFFLVMFIFGVLHGFLENYLFWYLEDLGASKTMFGLVIFVASVSGIPLLLTASLMIKKFGHINVMFFGFSAYIWRFFGYYLITAPWQALIIEVLECFTNALAYTSAYSYITYHSTPSTLVTTESIMGAIHWGLGRTGGSILGAILLQHISLQNCFYYLGVFTTVFTVVYGFIHHCFVKKYDVAPNLDDFESREEKMQIKKVYHYQ